MTLYISDLDGTLLDYRARLKSRSERMLNRFINKGVLFSYATARRFQTAGQIMQNVNMNIPVITMNGIILVDPKTGNRLSTEHIPKHSIEAAKQFIIANNETPIVYAHNNGKERVSFLENSHKAILSFNDTRKDDPYRYACNCYRELFEGEICYITFLNPESDIMALDSVFSNANGFNAVTYKDTYEPFYRFYETWSANSSKATSALKLKELVGADRLICFGDNINDMEMFRAADECYAVDNAVDELKAIATGIIPSNEAMGVLTFIEDRESEKFYYIPPVSGFRNETLTNMKNSGGIGTLNEKSIHAALKAHYSSEIDREAKIGSYYADAVTENGICEIQTTSWDKLNKKLECFLNACHVTVVYPFEKKVRTAKSTRNNKSLTKFMFELYRIRGFLTDKNLTVCIAMLEIRKIGSVKEPIALLEEIYLHQPDDYRIFLPDNLPEVFTLKEFNQLCKNCDGSILLEILTYMGIVRKCGKRSNAFLYEVT